MKKYTIILISILLLLFFIRLWCQSRQGYDYNVKEQKVYSKNNKGIISFTISEIPLDSEKQFSYLYSYQLLDFKGKNSLYFYKKNQDYEWIGIFKRNKQDTLQIVHRDSFPINELKPNKSYLLRIEESGGRFPMGSYTLFYDIILKTDNRGVICEKKVIGVKK